MSHSIRPKDDLTSLRFDDCAYYAIDDLCKTVRPYQTFTVYILATRSGRVTKILVVDEKNIVRSSKSGDKISMTNRWLEARC